MSRPILGRCRASISTRWRRLRACCGLTASASISPPSSARRWKGGNPRRPNPADPQVQAWWKAKVDSIYRRIPDFGGFVVKANSESQPGPRDYGKSQADGANVIADALKPHGGTVFWRAFVYSEKDPTDRHKQAYNEFKPQDGAFRDNVFVQTK